MVGVDDVLILRCILCVPMSTIGGYLLSFGAPTAARGRSGVLRNRKSIRHMGSGFDVSEPNVYY